MTDQTFENAIKNLEKIVEELETKDLTLEDAVKKFEEGVKLSKFCSKILDETEKKVTMLLKDNNGNIVENLFEFNKNSSDSE